MSVIQWWMVGSAHHPIGVGVGIGIGIDSDSDTDPDPDPDMIPTAIGTRLSCIEKMSKLQWWAVPTLRVHVSRTRRRCPTRMALIKDHLD
jgi:hypothetical protein